MIDKEYGKYRGVCSICGATTENFDTWEKCKDWLKENWQTKYDKKMKEWVHFCECCRGGKR